LAGRQISGKKGAVGAGRAGSEEAGMRMLKAGGNAVDAGVASILALSVTDRDSFCFGGEVPILIYMAEAEKVTAISGMGTAPQKANMEMFVGMDAIPGSGILPAAVPSVLATCVLALDKFGTMTFAEVVEPTFDILAMGGEEWFPRLANTFERLIAEEKAQGSQDRSAGLEAVRKYFYEGPIADELVRWNQGMGGLFSKEDLSNYEAKIEEPIHGTYRGYDVYKCGFWTQGPALIQALNILEDCDLSAMKPSDPEYIHLVVESLKLAFADRDTYYGDPDFVEIPAEDLLSKDYAAKRRTLIDQSEASLKHQPGDPWINKALRRVIQNSSRSVPPFSKGELGGILSQDTTTCAVADKSGNMFVATPSGWGSGVQPGSTGIVLGTRLQSLNLWPGHPNVIQPGKRPRITLTPTLVMKDEKPFMVVSVAGGDQQDQTVLQTILNVIEFGMQPQRAADTTRFGTNHLIGSFRQTPVVPGSLTIEDTVPQKTLEALREKGHRVKLTAVFPSQTVLIVWYPDGSMKPGGDLRKTRHVAAY
jgi:gamma-glutamyltranspeptidase/glutathione hydrolase